MTLIEVLIAYRNAVKLYGKERAANVLLSTPSLLWEDIIYSVSDQGDFIDAYGEKVSL